MHLFINTHRQKMDAFIVFRKKKRDAETENWGPGSHPVWTCHNQGQEKTVLQMDAESSPWGRPSLCPSAPLKQEGLWGGKGWELPSRIRYHRMRLVEERQSLRVNTRNETRRQRQGQTRFRMREPGSATDALTLPGGWLMTPPSLLSD